MIIEKIQQKIEKLYDVQQDYRAINYLISRSEAINLLSLNPHSHLPQEMFLVSAPDKEFAEIALYFDQKLLFSLQKNDPFKNYEENIADFCNAIEGVSHFIYFLHKAHHRYEITQLEMELQAEVDKFLMFYISLNVSENFHLSQMIFESLFTNYRLRENLTHEERIRYKEASSLASRYCAKLIEYFNSPSQKNSLINEVRSFYHLNQSQKIDRINQFGYVNLNTQIFY